MPDYEGMILASQDARYIAEMSRTMIRLLPAGAVRRTTTMKTVRIVTIEYLRR